MKILMSKGWKGHAPTVKPSTKATSGFFMGTAIPPQMARVNRSNIDDRDGQVKKVDKVRFS